MSDGMDCLITILVFAIKTNGWNANVCNSDDSTLKILFSKNLIFASNVVGFFFNEIMNKHVNALSRTISNQFKRIYVFN